MLFERLLQGLPELQLQVLVLCRLRERVRVSQHEVG